MLLFHVIEKTQFNKFIKLYLISLTNGYPSQRCHIVTMSFQPRIHKSVHDWQKNKNCENVENKQPGNRKANALIWQFHL